MYSTANRRRLLHYLCKTFSSYLKQWSVSAAQSIRLLRSGANTVSKHLKMLCGFCGVHHCHHKQYLPPH